MRSLYALVIASLLAVPVTAQTINLHGHPQKASYASAAEWPCPEAQGWWPIVDPIEAGHLHVAFCFPKDGEITSLTPFWVPFTLKLHNIDGQIFQVFGPNIGTVLWDATGTTTMPMMKGTNPGLLTWTGKALIDYTLGQQPWLGDIGLLHKHGWAATSLTARVRMTNGDEMEVQLVQDHFMLVDPTVPEFPASAQGRPGLVLSSRVVISNRTTGNALTLAGNGFGVMVTEINDYLPLLPIKAPWPTIVNFYNYTSNTPLPNPGEFTMRFDADLHHGVLGATVDRAASGVLGIPNRPLMIDPARLIGSTPPVGSAPNVHKALITWTQTSKGETIASTLAINVPIETGVTPPPPPTCTDPLALNFGGLLPCTYPPPVDVCPNLAGVQPTIPAGLVLVNGQCVPDWVTLSGVFQQQGTAFRFCATPSTCVAFVKQP